MVACAGASVTRGFVMTVFVTGAIDLVAGAGCLATGTVGSLAGAETLVWPAFAYDSVLVWAQAV